VSVLIEGKNVGKSFGGLTAVQGVDFQVMEGEIVGLIGPNGAGKTTLFNLITGVFPPDSGTITFAQKNIAGLKSFNICRLGIARTFQIVRPFLKMSCLENVLIGVIGRERRKTSTKEKTEKARHIMAITGIERLETRLAKDITLIEKKRLEVARALATAPKAILLDEVMAGLNPSEMQQAMELIEKIRTELKITILWIEHVMGAIMKTSDRVVVMDQGQKIMEGTPEEVVRDRRVIEAYLGENNA
jgi:branched-chain amino acid transport system ATP-binding protein